MFGYHARQGTDIFGVDSLFLHEYFLKSHSFPTGSAMPHLSYVKFQYMRKLISVSLVSLFIFVIMPYGLIYYNFQINVNI